MNIQAMHQPTNLRQGDSPTRFLTGSWRLNSEGGLERVGERTPGSRLVTSQLINSPEGIAEANRLRMAGGPASDPAAYPFGAGQSNDPPMMPPTPGPAYDPGPIAHIDPYYTPGDSANLGPAGIDPFAYPGSGIMPHESPVYSNNDSAPVGTSLTPWGNQPSVIGDPGITPMPPLHQPPQTDPFTPSGFNPRSLRPAVSYTLPPWLSSRGR